MGDEQTVEAEVKKLQPGTQVYAPAHKQPVTVETQDGQAVWVTWEEDGQKRRSVFARKQLQEVK